MTKVKNQILKEEYKLLADFAGYVYIPFENPKQDFLGWYWKDPKKVFKDYDTIPKHNKIVTSVINKIYLCRKTLDLMFRYDFNRIMRIVDVIEGMGAKVVISGNSCLIEYEDKYYKEINTITKLESIYDSCVYFVKWFNSVKKD